MYDVGTDELDALKRVLEKRKFFRYGGEEIPAVESEWASLIGVKHCMTLTSGTAALITGLQALGIGPGQSVLVPAYTFISTALAVTSVGAIPIFVDVDESLTMDVADARRKIRAHTGAIIPVHMQGMPCNLEALLALGAEHDIPVLEDCCQADGGSYKGQRLGSWGALGAYSFNQYKIISCGEGGACVTNDAALAERLEMAQDGSCSVWPETGEKSQAFFCGGNFRFNELNAAMLRVQVAKLDGILERLRRHRSLFLENISLPQGTRWVKTHDEDGQCGVSILIQSDTEALAISLEATLAELGFTVHRPIESGRHVYREWGVILARKGGANPKWDAFQHPDNQAIETNYGEALSQADDYLARTVLIHTPYDWSEDELIARAQAFPRVVSI